MEETKTQHSSNSDQGQLKFGNLTTQPIFYPNSGVSHQQMMQSNKGQFQNSEAGDLVQTQEATFESLSQVNQTGTVRQKEQFYSPVYQGILGQHLLAQQQAVLANSQSPYQKQHNSYENSVMPQNSLNSLNQAFNDLKLKNVGQQASEAYMPQQMKLSSLASEQPIQMQPYQESQFYTPTKINAMDRNFQTAQNLMPHQSSTVANQNDNNNINQQNLLMNLGPQQFQSAQLPQHQRRMNEHLDHHDQQIYYQKGNNETESLNKLTEMQDPSLDSHSNMQNHNNYFINNLLDDDDNNDYDHTNYSGQNIKQAMPPQGRSFENDNFADFMIPSYQHKLNNVKRGANSLDRQQNQRTESLQISEQLSFVPTSQTNQNPNQYAQSFESPQPNMNRIQNDCNRQFPVSNEETHFQQQNTPIDNYHYQQRPNQTFMDQAHQKTQPEYNNQRFGYNPYQSPQNHDQHYQNMQQDQQFIKNKMEQQRLWQANATAGKAQQSNQYNQQYHGQHPAYQEDQWKNAENQFQNPQNSQQYIQNANPMNHPNQSAQQNMHHHAPQNSQLTPELCNQMQQQIQYLQHQNQYFMQQFNSQINPGGKGIRAFGNFNEQNSNLMNNQSIGQNQISQNQDPKNGQPTFQVLDQQDPNSHYIDVDDNGQQKKTKKKQIKLKCPSEKNNTNYKLSTEHQPDNQYLVIPHQPNNTRLSQQKNKIQNNEENGFDIECQDNQQDIEDLHIDSQDVGGPYSSTASKLKQSPGQGSQKYQVKQKKTFGNSEHKNSTSGSGSYKQQRGGSGTKGTGNWSSCRTSGSHTSNQSYDEFIQKIQHEMKQANDDPEKEFKVLEGNIIELATKKVGSQFLQDHLKKAKQSLINKLIDQIDDHLPNLMMDNYGNYFCSQLIQYLQVHQRIHFLRQVKGPKFIEISKNDRGTHAIQTIIDAVTEEEEFQIIKETLLQNDNICSLSMHQKGEHLIQKIIVCFSEDRRQYIFDQICDNFQMLATDKQGLCVMKKLIDCTKKPESQKIIVDKILENCLLYIQNEFGNFVVSEVLNQYDYKTCSKIYAKIQGEFVKLSQNKYSSKFIEISIQRAPSNIQNEIFNEFCISDNLHKVVQSNFGNYVLQHSLEEQAKGQSPKIKLLRAIIDCLINVTEYKVQQKWGQEILTRFIKNISTTHGENSQEKLTQHLENQMHTINQKQKALKQQQMIQMNKSHEAYQTNSNKIYYQKSSNSSGNNSQNQGYERNDYNTSYEDSSQQRFGQQHSSNSSGHLSSPLKNKNKVNKQQQQSGKAFVAPQTQQTTNYNQEYYNQGHPHSKRQVNYMGPQGKQKRPGGETLIIEKTNIKFANKKD